MPPRCLSSLPRRLLDRELSGKPVVPDGTPLLRCCPPSRTSPVIADAACAVLGCVLLGFSGDGERLISYSHGAADAASATKHENLTTSAAAMRDGIWGQVWAFRPGQPLSLLLEAPLFVSRAGASEMRFSCFEAGTGAARRIGHSRHCVNGASSALECVSRRRRSAGLSRLRGAGQTGRDRGRARLAPI